MFKSGVIATGLAAVLGFSAYVSHLVQPQPAVQDIQIQWLIAHEPISLFDRAAQDFTTEFNKDSDGKVHVTVKILGPKDFGSTNGHLNTSVVMNALDSGKVQMATAVVGGLASSTVPQLGAMNLPYLFKDYPSAEQVLDGAAGAQMLSDIDANTKEKALAFTFSGGFMVIESDKKEITSASDLQGMTIGSIDGPVALQTLDSFGATAEPMDGSNGVVANSKLLEVYDGIETPYSRILLQYGVDQPKYVAETFHGLFTTVIMASDPFYESLSPQDQQALQKASQVAAEDERADAITLGSQNRQKLIDAGTIITTFPQSSTDQLRTDGQSVYQSYEATYGSTLVDEIEAEQQ